MAWLALGVAYSVLYAVVGAYLRPFPDVLPWFRIVALLLPPLAGVSVIVRRKHAWAGCHWLFSATIAVDIAGIAVLTGFLYSHFVIASDATPGAGAASGSLLLLSELQQFLVCVGMAVAAIWAP